MLSPYTHNYINYDYSSPAVTKLLRIISGYLLEDHTNSPFILPLMVLTTFERRSTGCFLSFCPNLAQPDWHTICEIAF